MNRPSSITFNVGAPTSRSEIFPFWNDTPSDPSMNLTTNALHKPSSNTLNVGAPTFFNWKSSGPPFVVAALQVGRFIRQLSVRPVVSQ
jgi:hypothetical protein